MRRLSCAIALMMLAVPFAPLTRADEKPIAEPHDYADAMRAVATKGKGKPGVVLHVGDSITYANPYSGWARSGAGKTDADKAALAWSHAGKNDDSDGWYLARFDHPDGGRSYTAAGGCRVDEMLVGGKAKMPALAKLLDTYQPQAVVFMLGTNDASAGRKVDAFKADFLKAVATMTERGVVPIVSTIPPHVGKPDLAKAYNEAIREVAKEQKLPLIDFEKEILARRADDWNGTLLGKGDVHPTANQGGATPASEPTAENLRNSGYLLRGWLSVKKIGEVKAKVFDGAKPIPEKPADKPKGRAVKVPVTRDTWFSNVGEEADGSNGGATRLKLKGHQEMSLIDIDPTPLKGHVVLAATLHLKLAGPERLHRVTVGTFASEWHEGTGSNYEKQKGASTHNRRQHPDVPWAGPGSDMCSVMLGNTPASTWRMADAWAPDAEGWQKVPVDPLIVQARIAGVSQGLFLFDDTGSEWTRDGEKWTQRLFPNRFVHSRESGEKNAPYLTVWLGDEDKTPPAKPDIMGHHGRGEIYFAESSSPDAVAYRVTVNGKPLPAIFHRRSTVGLELDLVPHLKELGEKVKVEIRAVDGAGNESEPTTTNLTFPVKPAAALPGNAVTVDIPKEAGALPKLGDVEVAVIDELDKVSPTTGAMTPEQPAGYLSKNHLWDAKTKRITLHAARNEVVAFQIHLRGPAKGVDVSLVTPNGVFPELTIGKYECVGTKKGPMPDPIVPLSVADKFDVPEGHKSGSLHAEFRVPKNVTGKEWAGKLVLKAGTEALELEIAFKFHDFEMPDRLSFLPEMNCYGLPADFLAWYRLAHEHRTVLNCVPYSQGGTVTPGWGPTWDGKGFDWKAWDAKFGPLFDGSAFSGPYRKGVPQECFYLPLHENWPTPMEGNYNGDYWADRAFPPAYRRDFVKASELFARHLDEKQWDTTLFQFFLNGKNNFKEKGWSRGSSPWLLDEPANFQDYWALRWYGVAFHEGVAAAAPKKANLLYRADISRPMWQRDSLDGLLDYNVCSGAFRAYRPMVLDRKRRFGEVLIEYGGSNAVEDSNMQPLGWCLDAWSLGADGVVPWLAVGTAKSWETGQDTCLLYPPRKGDAGPVASVRLKAYRRGQQDVEYARLARVDTEAYREALRLAGKREAGGFVGGEDAGLLTYRQLKPQDTWAMRTRLGVALDKLHPDAIPPGWGVRMKKPHPEQCPDRHVTIGELAPVANRPADPPAVVGPAETKTFAGRAVVRDTLISFEQPDKNFGTAGRDVAIRKADQTNAYLVRFDLAGLKGIPADKVESASLAFSVWDPSSRGNTKIVAVPLKTAWDEAEATWKQPAKGKKWAGETFASDKDAGPASPHVVVKPDMGGDTADPPIEVRLDVTDMVRGWLGGTPNEGVAITPVNDRAIDDGQQTRFQIHSSRVGDGKTGPRLVVKLRK